MNKLMQGVPLDKKTAGFNSIRNSSNRNNIGIMLAGAQNTPGSSTLNSQYTLTAKKSKRT